MTGAVDGAATDPAPRRNHRTLWAALAVAAVCAAAGYVLTCAMYPAPILPRQITVPALRGVPLDSAVNRLAQLGLRGRPTDSIADPLIPSGAIAWQSPAPNTVLPEGSLVSLGVGTGAPVVAVPDVRLLDLRLALHVIEAAGLRAGAVDTVPNDADQGTVLGMRPSPGSALPTGGTIGLAVSSGPPPVPVPQVVGLSILAARQRLAAVGLRVGSISTMAGSGGMVVSQRPQSGELVTRESAVDLTITGQGP